MKEANFKAKLMLTFGSDAEAGALGKVRRYCGSRRLVQ
jgi:hypothetical protein